MLNPYLKYFKIENEYKKKLNYMISKIKIR